jgi:hypothetical protein
MSIWLDLFVELNPELDPETLSRHTNVAASATRRRRARRCAGSPG